MKTQNACNRIKYKEVNTTNKFLVSLLSLKKGAQYMHKIIPISIVLTDAT
jgi:hypothetical protein